MNTCHHYKYVEIKAYRESSRHVFAYPYELSVDENVAESALFHIHFTADSDYLNCSFLRCEQFFERRYFVNMSPKAAIAVLLKCLIK